MILRRYGDAFESVVPNFKSHALSEISFRRDGRWSMPVDEFESEYGRLERREFSPEATGWVQSEVEGEVLERLEAQLGEVAEHLAEGEVVVVENEAGVDYPKLRERREKLAVEGQNRLRFHRWVDPPLTVGIFRRRG